MITGNTTLLQESNLPVSPTPPPLAPLKQTRKPMVKFRFVLVAFFIAFSIFSVTHFVKFPGSVAYLLEVTHGQKTLDLQASFSSAETYQRLEAFGESGRENYMRTMMTVDAIFPLSMFVFLYLLGRYTAERFVKNPLIRRSLPSFAVGYVLFDFLENLSIFIMLSNFPDRLDFLGTYVGVLTVGKRIAMIGAFFIPAGWLVLRKVSIFSKK